MGGDCVPGVIKSFKFHAKVRQRKGFARIFDKEVPLGPIAPEAEHFSRLCQAGGMAIQKDSMLEDIARSPVEAPGVEVQALEITEGWVTVRYMRGWVFCHQADSGE